MNSFTKELVSWIESNLDNNILLDNISEKSGYSKWHLQRMFKSETNINLASYVRQRRLSKAAIMLRMTSVLVCDIADCLGFSTQQTFTRTFTRHFGIAPGKYRTQPAWSFQGITSDLRLEKSRDLEPEVVFMEERNLSGIVLSYLCDCGSLTDLQFHSTHRHDALKQASHIFGCNAQIIAEYCLPAKLSENIKFNLILAPKIETASF